MATVDEDTYTLDHRPDSLTIEDIEKPAYSTRTLAKFVAGIVIGGFFFLLPIRWQGRTTIPMDVVLTTILESVPRAVGVYAVIVITAGGLLTTLAVLDRLGVLSLGVDVSSFDTGPLFWALRVAGVVITPFLFLEAGPAWLHAPGVGPFIWNDLVYPVSVLIPLGAIFVNVFVSYGALEFIGTLARPIMQPLFRVPGRAALDSITSWIASLPMGLYVTQNVFHRGGYSKREAYIIVTCFATVGIAFTGVVLAPLQLLHLLPVVMVAYGICLAVTAAILVRVPPLSRVPDEYIEEPDPETPIHGSAGDYVKIAFRRAIKDAEDAASFPVVARDGFLDGLKLVAEFVGLMVAVALAAVLFERYTPVFDILGQPLVPLFEIMGLPNAAILGPASLVGITEMFIPVILVQDAAPMARFYIALLTITQIIFFSTEAPMAMDMFQEVPIKARELVILFVERTIILIPLVALITHVVNYLGFLG